MNDHNVTIIRRHKKKTLHLYAAMDVRLPRAMSPTHTNPLKILQWN